MVSARTALVLVMAAVAVTGMVTPAAAGSALLPTAADGQNGPALTNGPAAAANHTNGSSAGNATVSVGVGAQLSTVIAATSDDTQTDYENAAFEFEFERSNESERAEALADRAEELRERAEAIREDYHDATAAFHAGDLTRDEYAQRIATLNGRATNVLASLETLQGRAETVSALELRVAGVNRSRLEAATGALDNVTGVGPAALLQRFTGGSTGAVELETADGLEIEVESEDGERSRELKRPRDADRNITVSGSAALETARAALSAQAGPWALEKSSVHPEDGYYKFEFGFRSANETGEAEVRVDGSTGAVFRLEEEVEPADDDDPPEVDPEGPEDDEEDDDEAGDVAVVLAGGTPAPGATITVQVIADGEPSANTTVFLNGEAVGTTDAAGQVAVTLPAGEAEITARAGGEDGELEFEFEADDVDEVFRNLDVSATIDNGTATVTVTFDGSGVADAVVYANDERVGSTSADGTVAFDVPTGTDELEIEVIKGEFEAELEFELADGELRQTGEAHEGDGDKIEDDEEDGDDEDDDGDDEGDEGDDDADDADEDDDDGSGDGDDEADEDDECDDPDADDDSSGTGSGGDAEDECDGDTDDDSSGSGSDDDEDDEDDSSGTGSGDDGDDTSGSG